MAALFTIPKLFVIHRVQAFSVVSEAEIDVFLKFSCSFNEATDVGNLIFGFCLFYSSLYIRKLSADLLLKPSLKDFEHYLENM